MAFRLETPLEAGYHLVKDGDRPVAVCAALADAAMIVAALGLIDTVKDSVNEFVRSKGLKPCGKPLTRDEVLGLRDDRGRVKVVFAAHLNDMLDVYSRLWLVERLVYPGELYDRKFTAVGVAPDGKLLVALDADASNV
jgi:hypothetical protein